MPRSGRVRRRADVESEAAAAAPDESNASAAAAAAASASSASAGGPAKRTRRAANEAGAAAGAAAAAPATASASSSGPNHPALSRSSSLVVPISDAPECPVCTAPFECDEPEEEGADSHVPRSLPCTHSLCSCCLLHLLTKTAGRVKCPTCRDDREVKLPAGTAAAAVSSPSAWLRLIPQSADIIRALRRGQQLEAALKREQQRLQPAVRCSDATCAAAAVKWCDECKLELCARHDSATHAHSLSGHKRILLADRILQQKAEQQARVEEVRAAVGAKLKTDVAAAERHLKRTVAANKDKVAALEKQVGLLRASIAAQESQLKDVSAAARRLSPLSSLEAQKLEATMDKLLRSVGSLSAGGLLADMGDEQRATLERFLKTAEATLDRAQLLYRASVDGFRRASFASKCVGEGRTLTLVKGSGFLFGAFSLPRWPADGTAADPTGKSFLFSLVNKLDRPARFVLRDAGHALEMAADGVRFGGCKRAGGAQTSWPNFGLMVHGRAGDAADGNTANHSQRYNAAYAPEDLGRPGARDEMCDETFFGGQQFFAAEEIEVYKL